MTLKAAVTGWGPSITACISDYYVRMAAQNNLITYNNGPMPVASFRLIGNPVPFVLPQATNAAYSALVPVVAKPYNVDSATPPNWSAPSAYENIVTFAVLAFYMERSNSWAWFCVPQFIGAGMFAPYVPGWSESHSSGTPSTLTYSSIEYSGLIFLEDATPPEFIPISPTPVVVGDDGTGHNTFLKYDNFTTLGALTGKVIYTADSVYYESAFAAIVNIGGFGPNTNLDGSLLLAATSNTTSQTYTGPEFNDSGGDPNYIFSGPIIFSFSSSYTQPSAINVPGNLQSTTAVGGVSVPACAAFPMLSGKGLTHDPLALNTGSTSLITAVPFSDPQWAPIALGVYWCNGGSLNSSNVTVDITYNTGGGYLSRSFSTLAVTSHALFHNVVGLRTVAASIAPYDDPTAQRQIATSVYNTSPYYIRSIGAATAIPRVAIKSRTVVVVATPYEVFLLESETGTTIAHYDMQTPNAAPNARISISFSGKKHYPSDNNAAYRAGYDWALIHIEGPGVVYRRLIKPALVDQSFGITYLPDDPGLWKPLPLLGEDQDDAPGTGFYNVGGQRYISANVAGDTPAQYTDNLGIHVAPPVPVSNFTVSGTHKIAYIIRSEQLLRTTYPYFALRSCQIVFDISGAGLVVADQGDTPVLRMQQRNDGRGITGHARIKSLSNGSTAVDTTIRLGQGGNVYS